MKKKSIIIFLFVIIYVDCYAKNNDTINNFISTYLIELKNDNIELSQKVSNLNLLLSIAEKTKNDSLRGIVYNNVAQFYLDQGDYLTALSYTDKSYNIFNKNQDTLNLAFSYLNYGRVNFHQGIDFFDSALNYFKKANSYYYLKNNIEGLVNTNIFHSLLLSDELTKNGRTEIYNLHKADSIIDYSLSLIKNNNFLLAKTLLYKGRISYLKNEFQQSYEAALKSIKTFKNLNNKYYLSLGYKYFGEILFRLSRHNESFLYFLKSEKLAIELNNSDLLNNLYEAISDRYYDLNDYKKSLDYFKLSVDQKFQLYSKLRILNISEYEKKIEIERKNKQIQLLKKDNEIHELNLNSLYLKILFTSLSIITIIVAIILYLRNRFKRKNDSMQNKLLLSKLQALQLQMNPHFIFNTMNSIKYLIDKKNFDDSSEYLVKLSRLMRMVLEKSKSNYISLKDEIEMLDLYIKLELLRFDDKFNYSIIYDEDINILTTFIPPMIIQPFIENAIYHGLNNKIDKGELFVSFKSLDEKLVCLIVDNGIGREKSSEINKGRINHNSLGISATQQRIDIINSAYNLKVTQKIEDLYSNNEAAGTKVEIVFPKIKEGELL